MSYDRFKILILHTALQQAGYFYQRILDVFFSTPFQGLFGGLVIERIDTTAPPMASLSPLSFLSLALGRAIKDDHEAREYRWQPIGSAPAAQQHLGLSYAFDASICISRVIMQRGYRDPEQIRRDNVGWPRAKCKFFLSQLQRWEVNGLAG